MNSHLIVEKLSSTIAFNGEHAQYSHYSQANNCNMKFAIFLPPGANSKQPVPVLYWLSGLTCTDENFMQKAGALRTAAQLGIAIVAPDTSPRGEGVPDDENAEYDFGLGAGFYLNATQAPWDKHYNMYDYLMQELLPCIEENFPVNDKKSISGHSMGGHGALTIGLKHPQVFASISAFSPICNPMNCPWGEKAFGHYLGSNKDTWLEYDACELIEQAATRRPDERQAIRIDQGSADNFLDEQLKPENLIKRALQVDYAIEFNMHTGYDHSYYFIASFIDEHLAFHGESLKA